MGRSERLYWYLLYLFVGLDCNNTGLGFDLFHQQLYSKVCVHLQACILALEGSGGQDMLRLSRQTTALRNLVIRRHDNPSL